MFFVFFFFPLGSGNLAQSPRVAGGRSPSSRGSGAWKLSPGGKQQEEGTGSRRHTWDLPAGVSARRNSAWTYSCLLLQQPVRAVMSQHHPKCLPLPGSQQLALLTLSQSSGQGFLFPGFPPTALKCPCTGLVLELGVITFGARFAPCLLESHLLVLTLTEPLRLRAALFSEGHGSIKADLARGLAATKGRVQAFSLEARKPQKPAS